MHCRLFSPKSLKWHPSAVNGAWCKINRMRLLWCACPVKTTCLRVRAFCIMHVWCSVSMPVQCTRIILILANSDGNSSQVCRAGIKAARGLRSVSRGRMRREALSYWHAGWGSCIAHGCGDLSAIKLKQKRKLFLPNGSRCVVTERIEIRLDVGVDFLRNSEGRRQCNRVPFTSVTRVCSPTFPKRASRYSLARFVRIKAQNASTIAETLPALTRWTFSIVGVGS